MLLLAAGAPLLAVPLSEEEIVSHGLEFGRDEETETYFGWQSPQEQVLVFAKAHW